MISRIPALTSALLFAATASAAPNHLQLPGGYDNGHGGFGQLFTAESATVAGLSLYIGDPSRPGDSQVDALVGVANLVLFQASNLATPVLLARTQVQGAGQSTFGLTTFYFESAIPTVQGQKYFVAIETSDIFGLGLRSLFSSTYEGGFEARLNSLGAIEAAGGGAPGSPFFDPNAALRDMSFSIQTAIPEPTTGILFAMGLLTLFLAIRRRSDA